MKLSHINAYWLGYTVCHLQQNGHITAATHEVSQDSTGHYNVLVDPSGPDFIRQAKRYGCKVKDASQQILTT